MLRLYLDRQLAKVHTFKFPAGESGVSFSVDQPVKDGKINGMITLLWLDNDDLINLMLLVDAVRREYDVELSLSIPYFPYARQDRVCNKGESLSVKVIADIINSLNFKNVYVMDPHSDVVGAVLNNFKQVDVTQQIVSAFYETYDRSKHNYLVSPDAGANKKVQKYAKAICERTPHLDGIIKADKVRDTATGKITDTIVHCGDLGDANLLVVDDICDNGGTFIPLAERLRGITAGSVNLFVTHGLFNSGVDKFYGIFDKIFTANSMMKPEFSDTHGILVSL